MSCVCRSLLLSRYILRVCADFCTAFIGPVHEGIAFCRCRCRTCDCSGYDLDLLAGRINASACLSYVLDFDFFFCPLSGIRDDSVCISIIHIQGHIILQSRAPAGECVILSCRIITECRCFILNGQVFRLLVCEDFLCFHTVCIDYCVLQQFPLGIQGVVFGILGKIFQIRCDINTCRNRKAGAVRIGIPAGELITFTGEADFSNCLRDNRLIDQQIAMGAGINRDRSTCAAVWIISDRCRCQCTCTQLLIDRGNCYSTGLGFFAVVFNDVFRDFECVVGVVLLAADTPADEGIALFDSCRRSTENDRRVGRILVGVRRGTAAVLTGIIDNLHLARIPPLRNQVDIVLDLAVAVCFSCCLVKPADQFMPGLLNILGQGCLVKNGIQRNVEFAYLCVLESSFVRIQTDMIFLRCPLGINNLIGCRHCGTPVERCCSGRIFKPAGKIIMIF